MIFFNSENDFSIDNTEPTRKWLLNAINRLGFTAGEINFIFCDDNYLLDINKKFLNHDTYTDIISFDYSDKTTLSGDIFISTERVADNAKIFDTSFANELHRVLIHGILHYAGFNDKTDDEKLEMRRQEDYYLSLREF